jgi:hypothetical protein
MANALDKGEKIDEIEKISLKEVPGRDHQNRRIGGQENEKITIEKE